MSIIVLITLVSAIFSPFLFQQKMENGWPIDIWHAQGIWTQLCLLIIFSILFFEKSKYKEPSNIPLGLLHLWVALFTWFICYLYLLKGKYNIENFFPYFNFLCLLVFYKAIVQYLNITDIRRCLLFMKYVILLNVFFCVLQNFDLSQFTKLYYEGHWAVNNRVNGLLGNGTHMSCFFAMSLPLFFEKSRENLLSIILILILMLFLGTTQGQPAISGFLIASVLLGVWGIYAIGRQNVLLVILGVVATLTIFSFFHRDLIYNFLSFNGRLEAWGYYWNNFIKHGHTVTGYGLGKINQIYQYTEFKGMRHLHLEYFQFLFEIGIIGFVLIINLIISFFKKYSINQAHFNLKLIVVGFLLGCFFNYPAHLWIPSTWAMFAYASFIAIKEQDNGCEQS